MSDFEIERGIPLPPPKRTRGKYPFDDMDVGDSFFVPAPPDIARRTQQVLGATGQRLKPRKFLTRRVEGGVRIWRAA